MTSRNAPTTLYQAAAARDASGLELRPAHLAVRNGQIVAIGSPSRMSRFDRRASVVDLRDSLILPQMVNAHAHLCLTAVGPQPYGGRFVDFLAQVLRQGPRDDRSLQQAVQEGLVLSRRAGVGVIGDVAPVPAAIAFRAASEFPKSPSPPAQSDSPHRAAGWEDRERWVIPGGNPRENPRAGAISGISFLEVFGIGHHQAVAASLEQKMDQCRRTGTVGLGISPHAPYSAGLALYREASRLGQEKGFGLCTHLAETREEIEFVRDGTGPLADLLKRLGRWDDSIVGCGCHPIDWLAEVLGRGRWLLAHCNYVEEDHLELLADCGASVAYCPIASEYFGHRDHRYRDMLGAGVNVCLGTDSIICQPHGADQPLGVLAQMRHLYRRDRADPGMLLAMATINGLRALHLDESAATFGEGARTPFMAVRIDPADQTDPLLQVLENDHPSRPLGL